MLDLDKYLNNSLEVTILGETIHVLEPSVRMIEEVAAIEADISKENINEIRVNIAIAFLNHNREGKIYKKDQLKEYPLEAIVNLVGEVSAMRLKADADPNLESPSQVGK